MSALKSLPSPLPPSQATTNLLSLQICLFWFFHINLSTFAPDFLLSIMYLRFLHGTHGMRQGVHSFYNWIVGQMASLNFAYPVISWWTRVQFLVLWLLWITLLWTLIYTVSPLHMNPQVVNFQRCERAFHQCQEWETLQLALRLLLLMIFQLCHLPSPLPPPGSTSSCLFTWCQTLYASCHIVLLCFSGYCTINLKCFIFCLFLCIVWKVL